MWRTSLFAGGKEDTPKRILFFRYLAPTAAPSNAGPPESGGIA